MSAASGYAPGYSTEEERIPVLVRSLLPVMEKARIATAVEVDVDTLAERLRNEAIEKGESVAYRPRLVGAWTRKA
jgi:hypothetical protein